MRLTLLAIAVCVAFLIAPSSVARAAQGCSEFDASIGDCSSGSFNGGGVAVGAGGGGGPETESPRDARGESADDECTGVELRDDECWTFTGPGDEPATDPVTWADIEHFIPTRDVATMEPSGWSVVGLHSNFFAVGGSHEVDGEVMGFPTRVRFTPRAWHWNYGDGSEATLASPGASWEALRLREFDRTPTSHVFERAGQFRVTLDVEYAAEYSFEGGGWTAIPGTLTLPSATMDVRIANASTVLVGDECGNKKSGPGC